MSNINNNSVWIYFESLIAFFINWLESWTSALSLPSFTLFSLIAVANGTINKMNNFLNIVRKKKLFQNLPIFKELRTCLNAKSVRLYSISFIITIHVSFMSSPHLFSSLSMFSKPVFASSELCLRNSHRNRSALES